MVATAPANVTVPSVIGNTATDARFKLENNGFKVTSDAADSDEPAGNVIDQNPAAGTSVAPGSRIVITVSNGPGGHHRPGGARAAARPRRPREHAGWPS